MNHLRDLARRAAPPGLRSAVRRFKKTVLGPTVFEVELGDYRFIPDTTDRPRFTLVIPSILRRNVFGGVATGIEIYCRLASILQSDNSLDLRVLLTSPEDLEPDNAFAEISRQNEMNPDQVEIVPRVYRGSDVQVRAKELFMPFNWTCASNLRMLLKQQVEVFGGRARPFVYPIQEYEPCFYPFSSDQLLAREVYDSDWPIHAVVNSSQLATWLSMLGHEFTQTHVFEPQMSKTLRPYLAKAAGKARKRRILLYGRPLEDRNCFPILREALQLWANIYPEHKNWEVVSAGTPHPPIRIGEGHKATSVGKLSLDDYASMLSETAIGVSLMASPHPSYPPLEMAHFGIRTITNRFVVKDLGASHDNIISLESARPEVLAETLAETCRAFDADPDLGARGQSHMPDYLGEDPFPFLSELAQDLRPFLN